MWRVVVGGLLVASGVAFADEPLSQHQLRVARDAAAHGHCDVAVAIASQVATTEPDFYSATFVVDVAIAACMRGDPPVASPSSDSLPPTTTIQRTSERFVSAQRIFGEIGLGVGLSVGVGAAGVYVGLSVGQHDCDEAGEHCGVDDAVVLGTIGLTVGATAGVAAIGTLGNESGSIFATFGGAALGSTLGLVGIYQGDVVFPMIVLPTVGAIVGFNATRRYDDVTIVPVVTGNTLGVAGTF